MSVGVPVCACVSSAGGMCIFVCVPVCVSAYVSAYVSACIHVVVRASWGSVSHLVHVSVCVYTRCMCVVMCFMCLFVFYVSVRVYTRWKHDAHVSVCVCLCGRTPDTLDTHASVCVEARYTLDAHVSVSVPLHAHKLRRGRGECRRNGWGCS